MYLEWPDIKATARTLHLHSKPKYGFKMKDHEERELPLSEELFDLLTQSRQRHPNSKLVFGTKNGKPNTKLLLLVKRRARRAGLNCASCDGCVSRQECERWFLHRFRATYCTKLLRSGMDLRTVQQMMGDSDLASTMRYLRPAENMHVQEKVNQINWYKGSALCRASTNRWTHIGSRPPLGWNADRAGKRGRQNATPRLRGYEVLPDRAILSKEMPGAGRVFGCFGLEWDHANHYEPPETIWAALADIVSFTSLAPLEFHSAL